MSYTYIWAAPFLVSVSVSGPIPAIFDGTGIGQCVIRISTNFVLYPLSAFFKVVKLNNDDKINYNCTS